MGLLERLQEHKAGLIPGTTSTSPTTTDSLLNRIQKSKGVVTPTVSSGFQNEIKGKPYSFTEELQLAGSQMGLTEKFEKLSEKQKKPGLLSKIFDVIQTGEYASGGLISGKGIRAGIREKITPSDALGIDNPFLGFATDVLLDPTTYLTFGAGAGLKVGTKAGIKIASKKGTTVMGNLIKEFGEVEGRNAFSKLVAEGGDDLLKKTGLKFMGKQILPEKTVKFPFKMMNTALEKAPVVSPIYKSAKDVIEAGFKPFAKIQKQLGEQGGAWVVAFQHLMGASAKVEREAAQKAISETFDKAFVKLQEEGRERMTRREFEERVGDIVQDPRLYDESETINSLTSYVSRQNEIIGEVELPRGLIRGIIPNYQRHFLTPEAAKIIEADPAGFVNLVRPLAKEGTEEVAEKGVKEGIEEVTEKGVTSVAKEGASEAGLKAVREGHGPFQHRRIEQEGIDAFKEKHGVDLFDRSAFVALSRRTDESIKARRLHDWYMGASENFGVIGTKTTKTIKDKNGVEQLVEKMESQYVNGIKHVESNVPELRGMLFPEPIVQHLNEVHKFLTDDKSAKTFLNAYDKILRLWKGSVTGWFPAFHGRNAIGGVFNNWLLGLNNPLRYMNAKQVLSGKEGQIKSVLGTEYSYSDIRRLIEEHSVGGFTGQMDVQLKMNSMMKQYGLVKGGLKALGSGDGKTIAKTAWEAPLQITEMVENHLRVPLFIDRLAKGDSPEIAAKVVHMAHFDYAPEAYTKFENDFMVRIMPFYKWCLSDDSEYLTNEGWKFFDQLKEDEIVMTWNPENKHLEWQQIKERAQFDFEGKIMAFKNSHHHWQFTDDHRWYVKDKYSGKYKVKRGYELIDSDRIPLTGDYQQEDSILTPQLAAILGWVVSDGYHRQRGNYHEMLIYQSPEKFADDIFELLEIDKSEYSRKPHPATGVLAISVPKRFTEEITKVYSSKKDLPKVVGKLSREAAQAMWQAMFDAEGHVARGNEWKFNQDPIKNKAVLDAFQMLTLMTERTGVCGVDGLYVKTSDHVTVKTAYLIREDYSGKVGCVVTDNQTFVARRNGSPFITGNTRNNIPLQIEQMMKQPGKYAAVGKLIESISEPLTQEQEDALPSYVKEGLYFKTTSEEGFMTIMAGMGLPVEDVQKLWRGGFAETLRGLFSEFSPIIKYPTEVATGMNMFFGEEIDDLDYVKPWVSKVPGMRDWLEVKDYTKADGTTGYRGNPQRLHAMNTLIGRFYTTIGKATETDTSKFNRILNFATGARVKTYKIESEQYWRDQEFQDELIKILHHNGVNVSTFENLSKKAREELGLSTGSGTTRRTEALIKEMRAKQGQ